MDIFEIVAKTSRIGYPIELFYLVAVLGIVLVVIRPFWAFLFVLLSLASRDYFAAAFTRTDFFGPYLNLNDLLLWIALFAIAKERLFSKSMRLWAPKILLAIILLIIIGDLQSVIQFGVSYEISRRLWSSLIFPVFFFISANMVTDQERAKYFFQFLFTGAVFAACQHLYFVYNVTSQTHIAGLTDINEFRNISYVFSGGVYILIMSIFTSKSKQVNSIKSKFSFVGLIFIAMSLMLTLTRTFYVVIPLTIISCSILLKKTVQLPAYIVKVIVTLCIVVLISALILPNLDIFEMTVGRFLTMMEKTVTEDALHTRILGAKTELELWLESSIILGVGTSLPPDIEAGGVYEVGAIYHIGITTYLAHFGIAGLIVYAFLLPFGIINISKKYLAHSKDYYGQRIALIAMVCALMDFFSLFAGHSHLGPHSHMMGMIYGAIWGLYRRDRLEKRAEAKRAYLKRVGEVPNLKKIMPNFG